MRWAWAALFALLAVAAVAVNMHGRRILVVHEGPAGSAYAQAFGRGLDSVLQPAARLKVRHQYMGFAADACPGILAQMKAFDPDTVIAEGPGAHACVRSAAAPAAPPVVLFQPALPAQAEARARYAGAWQRQLQDLAPPGGTLLVLRGAQDQAEYDTLAEAARSAGLRVRAWTDDGTLPPALAGAVALTSNAGQGWPDPLGTPQGGLLRALRAATPMPIVSTRLESLALGADLALTQAPEQRGEMLAQAALAGVAAPGLDSPYEMAVGMRQDFAQRQTLPPFYALSARMAGFLVD